MAGRTRLMVAVVGVVLAAAAGVALGNYTLAKEELVHQYKAHAEESVEFTKDCFRSWTAWLLNRLKQGLGYKPAPSSRSDPPTNHEDDVNHGPGKAQEIKTMAAGETEKATNKAKEKDKETVEGAKKGNDEL